VTYDDEHLGNRPPGQFLADPPRAESSGPK
jgi:hypothetical protein